jgi:hypothetical protein
MANLAAACAAVILAGVASQASAAEYQALTDFRTYCVANQADPTAISAAAQKAGWTLGKADDRGTELTRTDGGQQRALYLTEDVHDGVRIRGCLAGLMPGSAEVSTSVRAFMGRDPTNTNGGFTTWASVDRDGKRTFLSDQETLEANNRGETVVMISAGLRGPLATVVYTEVAKVGK